MWCVCGALDNLFVPYHEMNWAKPYKQQLTADQIIPQKKGESKMYITTDIPVL